MYTQGTFKLVGRYVSEVSEVTLVWKGDNCLTEMYSALRAEVPDESDDRTILNEGLLRALRESRSVIVCGQALSHRDVPWRRV
jgi:nicotinamidase-related amidase